MSEAFERTFRREHGRIVSRLVARLGLPRLEMIEDAVQFAGLRALERWPHDGTPDDPTAWLYRTAHNRIIDGLRTEQRHQRLLDRQPPETARAETTTVLAGELGEPQLAMLFACCDPALPEATQHVLALKLLFGLSVAELAVHLFTTEANVHKRLQRGRAKLRETGLNPTPAPDRHAAVLTVLHVLFSEGFTSYSSSQAVRHDLCDEAIRLAVLLQHHATSPDGAALVALMLLHRARLSSRDDGVGGLLLLSEQDRSTWHREHIDEGLRWLGRSAAGSRFSRFHAEAGIAAEHCLAPRFEQTRWDRVVACYALLERTSPSAVHRLGHALALAELEGPAHGLALLQSTAPPSWLESSFPWFAVLADLHHRCGHTRDAHRHRTLALDSAPTPALRALLSRRLAAIDREV